MNTSTINKITEVKQTNFFGQRGVDLSVANSSETTSLSIFCDILEPSNTCIKVLHGGEELRLLDGSVPSSCYVTPTVQLRNDSLCFIIFNDHQVHVKLTDEGVIIDIWDMSSDDGDELASNYLFFNELYEEAA